VGDRSLPCEYDQLSYRRCILTRSIDISSELKTALIEEYANEEQLSDSEAYRKIREYDFLKQFSLETRWWTRLSSHRATNLKQLLRHKNIIAAFNSLLKIPALLERMRISTLHKMFATRCDEINALSEPLWCTYWLSGNSALSSSHQRVLVLSTSTR